MRILITGASGFVGAMLVPRLLAAGHEVRAMAREPDRAQRAIASQLLREASEDPGAPAPEELQIEIARADAVSGAGLARALEGIDVAYYLIHSMERAAREGAGTRSARHSEAFPMRERISADQFSRAAVHAGVRRVIYLGGLLPEGWDPSPHLSSRHIVERIVLEAAPESLALRASIVIAARSRSFRLLVRLVERLPLIALPPWRRYRTQPIDGRDLAAMLTAAADVVLGDARSLDVAGPDVLSYEEMLTRIAESMLVRRPSLRLAAGGATLSARVAAAVASEDPELTVSLMQSLKGDLLPSTAAEHAARMFGVHLHSFDAAVEHALREWEAVEPLAAR
jgi:uncharacterized protein YbjT (DUF2867 family)